jgi:hypothetical protein
MLFLRTAIPSGAAKIQIAVISVAPFANKNSIAATNVPPVAKHWIKDVALTSS